MSGTFDEIADLPWITGTSDCCVNFKDSVAVAEDPANRKLQGMVVEEAVSYSLIQRIELAQQLADRDLSFKSYPLARIRFMANRKAFRLQVGDQFVLNYSPYGISGMICRVVNITEEDIRTEVISIEAIEDFYHISNSVDYGSGGVEYPTPGNTSLPPDYRQPVTNLTEVQVIEAPYTPFIPNSENTIAVIPIASQEEGYEVGYVVYMSVDGGNSYVQHSVVNNFAVAGDLVYEYPADTFQIDDEVGFYVDVTNGSLDNVESITRERLLGWDRVSLIGDEIITFQDIEPVAGYEDRFYISGVFRGRLDTSPETHPVGTQFVYIGSSAITPITSSSLTYGSTVYFKLVPYSLRDSGDISAATEIQVDIGARAFCPYSPTNLTANDVGINATYTGDIVLDWHPRVRGTGAGEGDPSVVTDASPTWEGKFHVSVWVGGSMVRDTDEINAITWTYTSAMNTSDNTSLASEITFYVSNYLTYDEYPGERFYSDSASITVKLAS
jgi:hypothetical protein